MTSIFKLNTVPEMLFNCVSFFFFFFFLVFGVWLARSLTEYGSIFISHSTFSFITTSPVPADADALGQLLPCSVCERDVIQTHKETFLTLEVLKT